MRCRRMRCEEKIRDYTTCQIHQEHTHTHTPPSAYVTNLGQRLKEKNCKSTFHSLVPSSFHTVVWWVSMTTASQVLSLVSENLVTVKYQLSTQGMKNICATKTQIKKKTVISHITALTHALFNCHEHGYCSWVWVNTTTVPLLLCGLLIHIWK